MDGSPSQAARGDDAAARPVFAKGRDLSHASRVLESWLPERVGATEVRVDNLRYPTGAGVSNETILFEAAWRQSGHDLRESLVLRVAPRPGPYQLFLDPQFEAQYHLLATLHASGLVKVPEVLWLERDASHLGAPFFVMRQVPGRVPVSMPVYNATGWLFDATPAQRRRVWETSVDGLASIHRVPLELIGFLDHPERGPTGFDQLFEYTRRHYEWAAGGRRYVVPELHLAWLHANLPRRRPTGLSWGDARMGNMMFDENFELAAIMDWEQASLGGPLQDLAWWLFFDVFHALEHPRLDGLGSRQETIERWTELTGLEVHDLLWYEVHAGVRLEIFPVHAASRADGPGAGGQDRLSDPNDNHFTRLVCELLDLPPPSELLRDRGRR